jgi:hypothetical protein
VYVVFGISGVIKMKEGVGVEHTLVLLDDDFNRMLTLPSLLLLDTSDDLLLSFSEVESNCSRITNSLGRPFIFGFLLRLSNTSASLSLYIGEPGIESTKSRCTLGLQSRSPLPPKALSPASPPRSCCVSLF